MSSHPLKPQRKHFKTAEEITEQYPDQLRKKQTTLDNHQRIHKMDEYR
jgi:hypothetical protein